MAEGRRGARDGGMEGEARPWHGRTGKGWKDRGRPCKGRARPGKSRQGHGRAWKHTHRPKLLRLDEGLEEIGRQVAVLGEGVRQLLLRRAAALVVERAQLLALFEKLEPLMEGQHQPIVARGVVLARAHAHGDADAEADGLSRLAAVAPLAARGPEALEEELFPMERRGGRVQPVFGRERRAREAPDLVVVERRLARLGSLCARGHACARGVHACELRGSVHACMREMAISPLRVGACMHACGRWRSHLREGADVGKGEAWEAVVEERIEQRARPIVLGQPAHLDW